MRLVKKAKVTLNNKLLVMNKISLCLCFKVLKMHKMKRRRDWVIRTWLKEEALPEQ